jgi:hypothetical protein
MAVNKSGLIFALWFGFITPALAQRIVQPPAVTTSPSVTAPISHEFVTGYPSPGGALSQAQPSTADLTTSINALIKGNGSVLSAYAGTGCTNQVPTAISALGVATCSSLTNAYLTAGTYSNITGTGTLLAGATGAGFTIALGASTVTGILGIVNGGTGSANWLGAGNVFTVNQTINLNAASLPVINSPSLTISNVDGTTAAENIIAAASGASVRMYRADGTIASPTTLVNTDAIGIVSWGGYNSSAYKSGAAIMEAHATETWSGATNGTAVSIQSTPNSSTTRQIEATFQGGIASGSGTPQGLGSVNAPGGFYVGSQSVINGSSGANFPGGLTATIASATAALTYACYNSSTGVFTYDSAGTCLVSSLRFKHDVKEITNPIDKIMALQPIDFVYNDQSNLPGRHIGLSAESVAAAVPELVTYDHDHRPEKVKYLELIGLLTAAIQDQQKEINALRH